ncbi:hypothetical protein [Agromyces sp. SYSU T0242]|uniref:hypothetical protein n=1 Tax=Agromyces litoreus TaxID=3158561 RepID=UPI00339B8381
MSESDRNRGIEPDDVEGEYTETEEEPAPLRTVEGEYTRTEGHEEPEVLTGYTSTEGHPDVHPASEEHGDYTREDERPKPHPGLHKG